MSDFFHNGWSYFIAGATLVGLIACLWLLLVASRRKAVIGPHGDDGTTGHVWDEDLKEMNNPLPRWWMGLFVLTVVFALVYLIVYPGLGNAAGTFGWSSAGQYQAEKRRGRCAAHRDFPAVCIRPARTLRLPPDFSSRRMPSMRISCDSALHMS